MGVPVIDTGPMTVEEFYAFTDAYPEDGKWELIDGEPVLNASPSNLHQLIVANVIYELKRQERAQKLDWSVIPGVGALISRTSRPEPDIMVLPKSAARENERDTDQALIILEVLSPWTRRRDLTWKRLAYTDIPALQHYVVMAQDRIWALMLSRKDGFAEQQFASGGDVLNFTDLGATLPLAEVYRDTGLV
jgi:Uma2 family endonuclease